MRKFPAHVTLDLPPGRWGVLVAALQEYVAKREGQGNMIAHEQIVEAWELLAIVDPEGERQAAEFSAQIEEDKRGQAAPEE